MKTIFSIVLLASIGFGAFAQNWTTDFEAAKEQAKRENKPIVLSFQGSDWCAPCMKLERTIWHSQEFIDHGAKHYILVKADFPRKKKNALPKEVAEANAMLAERYNQQGFFPLVVILDNAGKKLGELGYENITAQEYVAKIDAIAHVSERIDTGAKSEPSGDNANPYKRVLKLMGCRFELTVLAANEIQANEYIDMGVAEIQRIERMISSWEPNSQTSEINRMAGIRPVAVDPELVALIKRAQVISALTEGAFDISYASMDRIWKFDQTIAQMPTESAVAASVMHVGYQNIVIDEMANTVFLKEEGMKIGFGAIGKGYAADKAKQLLMEHGVSSGIINASGDMNTWGTQANGEEWQVAITNPMNKNTSFALLPVSDMAVVTSGNYEKFIEIEGRRYGHIIDPRTGYPASGLVSVTVFAPSAEMADALATSIYVMGKDVGLDLVDQLPQVDCIAIDDEGIVFTSSQIKINKS